MSFSVTNLKYNPPKRGGGVCDWSTAVGGGGAPISPTLATDMAWSLQEKGEFKKQQQNPSVYGQLLSTKMPFVYLSFPMAMHCFILQCFGDVCLHMTVAYAVNVCFFLC